MPYKNPDEHRKASARYYARHKERALGSLQRWREKGGRQVQRSTFLKRKYGISVEDYDRMTQERNGLCDICGRPPRAKKLHVDHDHDTGKVRGLLCFTCNTRLVFIEEGLHMKALKYLEKAKSRD